jgi:hypothetical protein
MSTATKTETEKPCSECATECAECGNEVEHWWEDEEGAPFCVECFTEQGISCDGCYHDECPQCNEEEEEECEACETKIEGKVYGTNADCVLAVCEPCWNKCLAEREAEAKKQKEEDEDEELDEDEKWAKLKAWMDSLSEKGRTRAMAFIKAKMEEIEARETGRRLGEKLFSEDAETVAEGRAELRRLAGIVE